MTKKEAALEKYPHAIPQIRAAFEAGAEWAEQQHEKEPQDNTKEIIKDLE